MGLCFGKADLHPSLTPFIKLPKQTILKLLTAYHNISTGFGISNLECVEVLKDISDDLRLGKSVVVELGYSLFESFDTDKNELIDALELLSTIAITSGMNQAEIVEFCLTLYDFNNAASLSFDEVVLAIKSAVNGLCKIHDPIINHSRRYLQVPTDDELENLVSLAFGSDNRESIAMATKSVNKSFQISTLEVVSIKEITESLLGIPEISSWLLFFAAALPKNDSVITDIVRRSTKTSIDNAVADWNISKLDWETPSQGSLPWRSSVALLVPFAFANIEPHNILPSRCLKLNWMYGYQTENRICNVFYNHEGKVIYTVSKFVIVYKPSLSHQSIFTHHDKEISCISICPNLKIIASAEQGTHPTIMVWSSDSLQVYFKAKGWHEATITCMTFSPSSKILLSVDGGQYPTLIASNWESGEMIFKESLNTSSIRCCAAIRDDIFTVATNTNEVIFWKYQRTFVRLDGQHLKNFKSELVTAMLVIPGDEKTVMASTEGSIMLWTGINCVRKLSAHRGTVNVLCKTIDGFLSGGDDGIIRKWNYNLSPVLLFDVSKFGPEAMITSMSSSRDDTTILFSTKGANIFEISSVDGSDLHGGSLIQNHASGVLHDLDTHPNKKEFATVGSDQTLRVFSTVTKAMLKIAHLDVQGTSLAYSPLGDVIVVGTKSLEKGGVCMVLAEENLSIQHIFRDSKVPITIVKFSNEGETLAVGADDGAIYLYSVQDDYDLIARCSRHTEAITHIDFSVDGEWLRSNAKDGNLCFFNVDDGSFQSNISSMRDVIWASQTCPATWHTKSIHYMGDANEVVTCCAIPPPPLVSEEDDETQRWKTQVIVTGSNAGQLRVLHYPCVLDCAPESYRYQAHHSTVKKVKFTFDSEIVLSIGHEDRCVIQWRLHNTEISNVSESAVTGNETGIICDEISFELIRGENIRDAEEIKPAMTTSPLFNDISPRAEEMKPSWVSSTLYPSNIPAMETGVGVPVIGVQLDHVYGYETRHVRNNLFFTKRGELLYSCSSYGLVWNLGSKSQRVYKIHRNAITAIAFSQDSNLVATGEVGNPTAVVAVWDVQSCQTVVVLPEMQVHSVQALRFSSSAQYLAVVSNDRFHTLTVFDWRQQVALSKFYAGIEAVFAVEFLESKLSTGVLNVVTTGQMNIRFWQNITSKFYTCSSPNYENIGCPTNFLCCESMESSLLVGGADGNLYSFSSNHFNLIQLVKAHVGPVLALCSVVKLQNLLSGGKDGCVRMWSQSFDCLREFKLDSPMRGSFNAIRAVTMSTDHTRIFAGIQSGEIVEVGATDGFVKEATCNIKGHTSALFAFAVHPKLDLFATAGDDAILRLWDYRKRAMVKAFKLEHASRTLAFNPEGTLLAIGYGNNKKVKGKTHAKEGGFIILSVDGLKVVHEGCDTKFAITCIKFSPNGKVLAMGSEDTKIRTYNVHEQFSHRNTVTMHQASIVAMDFSESSNFIKSIDQANRVNHTFISTGLNALGSDVCDERWSENCVLQSWDLQGLWLSLAGGQVPTVAKTSYNGQIIASANQLGDVLIHKFPALNAGGVVLTGGHNGKVSGICWMRDDSGFLTSGSDECTVLQWKCTFKETSRKKVARREDERLREPEQDVKVDIEFDDGKLLPWTAMVCEPNSKSNLLLFSDNNQNRIVHPDFGVQYIHGAQQQYKNGLFYNPESELIYSSGNIGIVNNRKQCSQIFYFGHRTMISSLAINESRTLIASGDTQSFPELHIWDARGATCIKIFKYQHKKQILGISFSKSSKNLVSLSCDDLWHVNVYFSFSSLWSDSFCVATTAIGPVPVRWVLYADHRKYPIIAASDDGILHFFAIMNGSMVRDLVELDSLHQEAGWTVAVESSIKLQPTNSMVSCVVCGSTDGSLITFNDYNEVLNKVSAHHGAVATLLEVKHQPTYNESFVTMGDDLHIKLWDSSLQLIADFNLAQIIVPTSDITSIKPLASTYNPERKSLALALSNGDIWELSLHGKSKSLVTESHLRSNVHGLSWNPFDDDEYATAGDDGWMHIWNFSLKFCVRRVNLRYSSRAISWSPNGKMIIVGVGTPDKIGPKDGAIMVLDSSSLDIIVEEKKAHGYITDIQFPENQSKFFACSASDSKVHIIDTESLQTLCTVDADSNRPAKRVDFSRDASFLRIWYHEDRMCFYNVKTKALELNPLVQRDVQWSSTSCPFSWHCKAATQYNFALEDVNSLPLLTGLTVHATLGVMAAAFNNGSIVLHSYPLPPDSSDSGKLFFNGVSSQISRMAFSNSKGRLIMIDSDSGTIFQVLIKEVD